MSVGNCSCFVVAVIVTVCIVAARNRCREMEKSSKGMRSLQSTSRGQKSGETVFNEHVTSLYPRAGGAKDIKVSHTIS